jgi:hypothetical protein
MGARPFRNFRKPAAWVRSPFGISENPPQECEALSEFPKTRCMGAKPFRIFRKRIAELQDSSGGKVTFFLQSATSSFQLLTVNSFKVWMKAFF